MATWKLSPQYKKSAVEKMFFYKEGKIITIEQGFRWATFSVESDERPLTDEELLNENGYELSCIDNDESWEMWDMVDGCWLDIELGNEKATSTDLENFQYAWEQDSYEGVEALGWYQDDTEYYYYGPLELTNEDTGEVFKGEPDEDNVVVHNEDHMSFEEKLEIIREIEDEKSSYTEWFPASINPVRTGTYQVLDQEEEVKWPFQSNIIAGTWDGEKWDVSISINVIKWRGLNYDPTV